MWLILSCSSIIILKMNDNILIYSTPVTHTIGPMLARYWSTSALPNQPRANIGPIVCVTWGPSKRSKAKLERLLKAKSSHSFNLIDEFENQRCQILFNKLEWKEQMETKMLNRFEIKTTAVTCSKVSLFHTNSCRQSEKELQS